MPASSPAASPSGSADPLDEKMRHCPLTVDGAKTVIADVEGAVELTVTAPADSAIAEMRRRVRHLEDLSSDKPTGVPHGAGAGGGGMRNCPVVSKGTRITGTDITGGVRIRVEPRDAAGLSELRDETRKRFAALPPSGP